MKIQTEADKKNAGEALQHAEALHKSLEWLQNYEKGKYFADMVYINEFIKDIKAEFRMEQ